MNHQKPEDPEIRNEAEQGRTKPTAATTIQCQSAKVPLHVGKAAQICCVAHPADTAAPPRHKIRLTGMNEESPQSTSRTFAGPRMEISEIEGNMLHSRNSRILLNCCQNLSNLRPAEIQELSPA